MEVHVLNVCSGELSVQCIIRIKGTVRHQYLISFSYTGTENFETENCEVLFGRSHAVHEMKYAVSEDVLREKAHSLNTVVGYMRGKQPFSQHWICLS